MEEACAVFEDTVVAAIAIFVGLITAAHVIMHPVSRVHGINKPVGISEKLMLVPTPLNCGRRGSLQLFR